MRAAEPLLILLVSILVACLTVLGAGYAVTRELTLPTF